VRVFRSGLSLSKILVFESEFGGAFFLNFATGKAPGYSPIGGEGWGARAKLPLCDRLAYDRLVEGLQTPRNLLPPR
jgi:hypothetical protein